LQTTNRISLFFMVLGAFAFSRKASITFTKFVRQSVCKQCISSSLKGRIFVKFYIGDFALKFIKNNFTYLINARSREHSNWRFVYNRKTY
jgi:hypothetical protein